ncbi:GAF domain-containing SpoIIE family protein phosphatase [Belliella kenyensis]|uniref:GAF domain-containing SpoIIE family protein phosphatase n=1 Tax=Belliella kenyensis TaxID=1472724 RepID=A0ABV8EPM0_9BACT|nr:PP2C family protein-serine/threonine phosphatase [Belliella kenyensis]MCH7402561.1 PP2C family protein-serine/threonine phosphatase [Belliella kenyensis]MDN3603359.1 PP2C family protein-serine/threonine phosphatase [Belliella kenyensis]
MLKLPNLNIGKISLLVAIMTWLALLFVDITRLFGKINQLDSSIAPEISYILQIIFFIMVYLFFHHSIQKSEKSNFLDLIWRGASTGLLATVVSLLISLFYYMLGDSRLASDPILKNVFYHIDFGFITLFLVSCTLLWKHLILYQKNKRIVNQWQGFEVGLLISMFFVFFNQNSLDYSFLFGLGVLVIFGISLSVNLKWIPYLTFKEKWKSILYLVVILISSSYLFIQILSYSSSLTPYLNLTDNLFLLALFAFVFIYSLFSFLVTLFNLPTSSVFEQKLVEAINFQRLSQSIKPGQNENQVLDILMDSCMSAAYVDAAWMEILDVKGNRNVIHQRFIGNKERKELQKLIEETKPFSDFIWDSKLNDSKTFIGKLTDFKYKSAMIIPLVIHKKTLGKIYLVKEVKDGFNKEMTNIIATFVGQACISVENYRLLNEALKNERYKEELQIAQRVQRSLLPSKLHHDDSFQIHGFSEAADEVGGDYYETQALGEGKYAIIIGDVSGKGTSAAFNMSQMKGVFHSLVQLNPSPSEFLIKANSALSHCLERNHFITTSYYVLDTVAQEITYSRAGHCPTLFFKAKENASEYLSIDGMGLGVLRSKLYEKYVHQKVVSYEPGDIMILFTDGIIEAKNQSGEEFGYERLKKSVNGSHELTASQIQQKIIEDMYEFIGSSSLPDDDYSLLVIKFLQKPQ